MLHPMALYSSTPQRGTRYRIFAPKCHPELQYATESSWAKMGGYIRRNCKHTLPTLRLNIIAALQPENIPLTLVQKWLRKMRDYMVAYEAGADGKTADNAVKRTRGTARSTTNRRPALLSYRRPPGWCCVPTTTRSLT